MSKIKILIISQFIYPRETPRANRATELAKEFGKQGHDVTLYAVLGKFDYTRWEKEFNVKVKNIGNLILSKTRSDSSVKKNFIERALRKTLRRIFEFPDIELMFKIPKILKQERGNDLIITIGQPHPIHWGMAIYRRRQIENSEVWVADCGDPYMGNKVIKPSFFYFKYFEELFCKEADYITVPVEGAVDGYFPEFHSKIKVIPQGFNPNIFKQFAHKSNNDIPLFAYAGLLFKGSRDPGPLLAFLSSIKLPFKFFIFTNNFDLIQPFTKALGSKIVLSQYIPRTELLEFLGKMDFVVNFENETLVQSPSKLIEYALLEKPILSINNSQFSEGVVKQFLNGDYSGQKKLEYVEQYEIENVAMQFLALYGKEAHEIKSEYKSCISKENRTS